MLIVPVKNDSIKTDDGDFSVVKFSWQHTDNNVICTAIKTDTKKTTLIPFSEIKEIQGVKVELTKNNLFKSYGQVDRKFQLPQKKDIVKIRSKDDDIVISDILLKEGILYVKDEFDEFLLSSIFEVKYSTNHDRFNRLGFLVYYQDYISPKK